MRKQQQIHRPSLSDSKIVITEYFDTPENHVSNVDRRADKRIIFTSLINSSPTLFYFLIRAIYNRVHRS